MGRAVEMSSVRPCPPFVAVRSLRLATSHGFACALPDPDCCRSACHCTAGPVSMTRLHLSQEDPP